MLTIRLKKAPDGTSALTLVRADGSTTWQRQLGAQARFFPHHDLTHFAVETELDIRRGFYGLVAEGWEFSDFADPWPKGALPPEALAAETIVGMLDVDRAMRARGEPPMTAAGMTALIAANYEAQGNPSPPVLTEDQLARIRARLEELFAAWESLAAGEAIQIRFGPGRRSGEL